MPAWRFRLTARDFAISREPSGRNAAKQTIMVMPLIR